MTEQSESFRKALVASQDALTHSFGKTVEAETVLTEGELCSRLMRIRARLEVRLNCGGLQDPNSWDRVMETLGD